MEVSKDNFSSSNSTNNTLLGTLTIDSLNSSISSNSKEIMGTTKIDKDRIITTTAPTIKKKAGTKSSNSMVIISTNSSNITIISRMILSHTKVTLTRMDITIKTNTEGVILITLTLEMDSSRIESRVSEKMEAISGVTITRETSVTMGRVLAGTMNHKTIPVLSNITSTHMSSILTVNW
jgi:hypothetical protein